MALTDASHQPAVPLTVTELTRTIKHRLESAPGLRSAWVVGEVSNLRRPGSGHGYFTLKDDGATLRCKVSANALTRGMTPGVSLARRDVPERAS